MMLSGDTLAAELNRLGVPFVRGATRATVAAQPAALLANLASSPEARLRAAIIPLLLWRPRLASAAPVAVDRLSPDAQTVLKCYYTAALLLQSKYAGRLAALHAEDLPLTDYFSHQLGLMRSGRCDLRLAALARRQAALSGEAINWLGTYEHAADSFLSRQERAHRWTRSTQILSSSS